MVLPIPTLFQYTWQRMTLEEWYTGVRPADAYLETLDLVPGADSCTDCA